MRRQGYFTTWSGPQHPDTDTLILKYDRTFQVWEHEELTQFVLGPPEITAWTTDGKPFQFTHPVLSIDEDGQVTDWPMVETVDRPLEVKNCVRLA